MKYFNILILTLFIGLISCEKEKIDPYEDMGVLPSYTPEKDTDTLKLDGTTWVLTYFQKGFANETPNDTIVFSMYDYTLNGKKYDQYNYVLQKTMDLGNPLNLILYGFSPFGDNGIWQTTLVNTFIYEGEINLSVFKNTNKTTIKATFERIK